MELVSASPIYAIVAIGFMIPAEKLMRKFFGFDNAGTLSAAGSFAGGAVFSAVINRLNKPKPGKGGPGGGSEKETPRFVRKTNSNGGVVDSYATLTGGSGGGAPTGGAPTGGGAPPAGGMPPTGGNVPGLRDSVLAGRSRWDIARGIDAQGNRTGLGLGARFGNAVGAAGYRNYRKLADRAKTLPKTAGRFVRRTAVGAAGAVPLAVLGAGVGIASGDPSKAFQYAAAGGAAGYYGANYYGDKVAKGLQGTGDTARNAFWGSDVKLLNIEKHDREFKESAENIDILTQALGTRDKAKRAMQDGSVQALLNNGIADPKKVGKALKLRDKYVKSGMNDDAALQRAVSMAVWNRDSGKGIYEINSRARESFIKQTVEQIKQSGVDEAEAKSRVQQILDDMESFEL